MMQPKLLTFETTPNEAALSNLIYMHFIRGSGRTAALIIGGSLVIVLGLLLAMGETPELEITEHPLEAIVVILGTVGSWMLMQFWSYRQHLKERLGQRWRIAMALDSNGVKWMLEKGDERMAWSEFARARVFLGRLYLLPKDGGHIALYARAFGSHEEFLSYAKSVQDLINLPTPRSTIPFDPN